MKKWTCSQGHEWEADTHEAGQHPRCPVCHGTVVVHREDAARAAKVSFAKQPPRPVSDAVTLSGYEILSELGRGAMGVVYQARQIALNRVVALKMLLAGAYASPKQMARFKTEAEVLARLQHPNIVQVFDVGEEKGRSFFAMEYVVGGTLSAKLEASPPSSRQAAQMMVTLADAMHAAHQVGIVHRDLKPANVLVSADGVLKITDFGLAKRMESTADLTDTGATMGTPSYMAPEQAWQKSKDVGPTADVYSLGAILYEMLTARPPFLGDTPMATVLQVTQDDPVPPSDIQPRVPADLETICLKCLEKSPRKRYRSAEALAEDLRLFIAGEPIRARPIGAWERAVKWMKRHPTTAVATIVSAAAAVVLLLVLAVSNVKLQRERDHAVRMEELASNNQARAEEREAEARRQVDLTRRSLYALQLSQVAATADKNPALAIDGLIDTRRCPFDLRELTWDILYDRCLRHGALALKQDDPVTALAVSADNKLAIATGPPDKPGVIRLWDPVKGQELNVLRGHRAPITALAFAADGQTLTSAGLNQTVIRWDCSTGKAQHTLQHGAPIRAMALSRDGRWLATAGEDRLVKIWDWPAGKQQAILSGHAGAVWSVAFSGDGRTLASGSADTTVKLWEVADWKERATLQGHMGIVTALAFAPDGATLAAGEAGARGGVRLWNPDSARLRSTIPAHSAGVFALVFTPDGKSLVSGGSDGSVTFMDAVTGQERVTLPAHTKSVDALAISASGKTLVTGSRDQTVLLWSPAQDQAARAILHGHAGPVTAVAFAPDDQSIATASADQTVKLWSRASGQEQATLEHQHWVWTLAYSPDGALLASGDAGGIVKIWDVATRKEQATLKEHTDAVRAIAFAPNGKTLATGSNDRSVKVWDVSSGEVVAVYKTAGWVGALAWTPDGKNLAAGVARYDQPGEVKLWDVSTNQEVFTWRAFSGKITALAFSGDGSRLAASSEDWTVKLWDVAQRKDERSLTGYGLPAFAADGKSMAVAAANHSVKLLDISGRAIATFTGHKDVVTSLSFSPDTTLLATASWDQTVRLWKIKR